MFVASKINTLFVSLNPKALIYTPKNIISNAAFDIMSSVASLGVFPLNFVFGLGCWGDNKADFFKENIVSGEEKMFSP